MNTIVKHTSEMEALNGFSDADISYGIVRQKIVFFALQVILHCLIRDVALSFVGDRTGDSAVF